MMYQVSTAPGDHEIGRSNLSAFSVKLAQERWSDTRPRHDEIQEFIASKIRLMFVFPQRRKEQNLSQQMLCQQIILINSIAWLVLVSMEARWPHG